MAFVTRKYFLNSVAWTASKILSKVDQKKLIAISVVQILMGVLDLLGVIAIGTLAALSVQGLESRPAGNRVSMVLKFLGVSHAHLQTQVVVLGVSAAAVLILKTVFWSAFSVNNKFKTLRCTLDECNSKPLMVLMS
jgi:hypothetical protein